MGRRVLITGGAGFIGSHLADELLQAGYQVRVLDNLCAQVHPEQARPQYLHRDVELMVGDVRDRDAVRRALERVDLVCHLAAAVGVGQSMYEIDHYTDVNSRGTAVLLEALIDRPVERLVVASSMSIYGEGLYRTAAGEPRAGVERSLEQLKRGQWELSDDIGKPLEPLPTPETKIPALSSVYALSKFDQERMCLIVGRAYGTPTVALRFFNVYGPRQALSNPYTGVLAIFASRYLNAQPPLIYEDGLQQRDFVSVHDVARACRLALESDAADAVFNIGSGQPRTVLSVARRMASVLDCQRIAPQITGRYRAGDIRHCYGDITLARRRLNYEPRVSFENGLLELAEWLRGQSAADNVSQANAQLAARGLTV